MEFPLETDSIVPKKEVFSVPQLGQGPFTDKTMLVLVLLCRIKR